MKEIRYVTKVTILKCQKAFKGQFEKKKKKKVTQKYTVGTSLYTI